MPLVIEWSIHAAALMATLAVAALTWLHVPLDGPSHLWELPYTWPITASTLVAVGLAYWEMVASHIAKRAVAVGCAIVCIYLVMKWLDARTLEAAFAGSASPTPVVGPGPLTLAIGMCLLEFVLCLHALTMPSPRTRRRRRD